VNAQTQQFANDLYNKVPRKGSAQVISILFISMLFLLTYSFQPVNHAQFLQAVDYVKKNESYKLLEDDEEDKQVAQSSSIPKQDSEEKKSKRKQHARKKTEENQWEDDQVKEEEPALKKVKTGTFVAPLFLCLLKLCQNMRTTTSATTGNVKSLQNACAKRMTKAQKRYACGVHLSLITICLERGIKSNEERRRGNKEKASNCLRGEHERLCT